MVWPPTPLATTHLNGQTIVAGTDNDQAQYINDLVAHVVALESSFATLGSTVGLLAARPAANAVAVGSFYLATDISGGTLYRSNGTVWSQAASGVLDTSGRELGLAEDAVGFTTSSTTIVDYAALTVTVTVGARPIRLICELPYSQVTILAGWVGVFLREGGTSLNSGIKSYALNDYGQLRLTKRLAPSPGLHTYKVSLAVMNASMVFTSFGTATVVPHIQVVEC